MRSSRLTIVTLGACLAFQTHAAEVLRGTRIYAAPGVPAIDKGLLVLNDGKIVDVGTAASIRAPKDSKESSCSGGVIVAGFQNSHVHLTGEQFADAARRPKEALRDALVAMLTRYGFTTIVDAASDRDNTLALRARVEKGEVTGPRILTAGLPLYPPDGIPFYLDDLPKSLRDRLPQPTDVQTATRVVRENLDAGVDGTKLFIATPQRDRSVKRMPADVAAAAVKETHLRGKLAMAHPTDLGGVQAAVAANVDIVMHTTLGDAAWPDPIVREMIRKKMSLVPTLQLWPFELKKNAVPEGESQKLTAGTTAQLRAFGAAGGQVLFGTDVGYITEFDPTPEYEYMAKAGLTWAQILASLTTAPAERWGESGRRGKLARNYDADIVVLEGDPSTDIRNFARVRCTLRAGKIIYAK